MVSTFDIVLDHIQTFTQTAVHSNRLESGIEHPQKYFLLCSSETQQCLKSLRDSLKQRCNAVEKIDSEVYLQNEITPEIINPQQGWHSYYNVICKATDYPEMEKFLPKLADCFAEFYHFNGTMVSKVVKLNIILLFTIDDLNALEPNKTCKNVAKKYASLFHQLFHNSKLQEEELSCVSPACDVLFVRIPYMDDVSMSALASDLFYLRMAQNGSLLSSSPEDYDKFSETDYPWTFYSVQNSYCAERIMLCALRESINAFYPCNPENVCNNPNISEKIREKLLEKMELDSLSDLERLIVECCCFVPISITKERWDSIDNEENNDSAQVNSVSSNRGIFNIFKSLFIRPNQTSIEINEKSSLSEWNMDTSKLEESYRQYLQSILSNDYFFDLLFNELSGMVTIDCDDTIYMKVHKSLQLIIRNVFHDENIPSIWQNTGDEYIEALTLEKVKLQCKKIQENCAELIKKIKRQEKIWSVGMASLAPPNNFNKYLHLNFQIYAGNMERLNRQLIQFLKRCQSNTEAIKEFQKDYDIAKSGIAFHEDPVNPFVPTVHVDNAPEHNKVDCGTFRLHCWRAVSLNVMKN